MSVPNPLAPNPIFEQWVLGRLRAQHRAPRSIRELESLARQAQFDLGTRVSHAVMNVDDTQREYLPHLLADAAVGEMLAWMREGGLIT